MKYTVTVDYDVFEIEVGPEGRAWVNQEPYEVDLRHLGANGLRQSAGEYSLLVDNRSYEVRVHDSGNGHQRVMVNGRTYRTRLQRGHRVKANGQAAGMEAGGLALEERSCQTEVRAPLPGLLVELRVHEGEPVEEQQVVAVVESMKMNLEIRAPRGGVVQDLRVLPGRQVAQDEVLAVLGSNGLSSCP